MIDDLKSREIEILRLMAEGLTNREIAERIYIGVETVRWYAKQIYSKFNVSGREEAVARAASLGLLDADPEQFAKAPQPTSRHNLPAQLTSFIGREKQITEVTDLFSDTRLLTLTGPGGTGKTRLALKVAEGLLDNFSDGIYFVDLAPVSDSDRVANAIANTLGIIENVDQPMIETLKGAIGQRETLLLLDNYEHVIAAAAVVPDLLSAAPNIKIVATSREPLRVSGEQVYAVPPLSLTADQQTTPPESVALFAQRAQAVKQLFQLDKTNTPTVREICSHLDGMPLAIELAAAQSRFLTPDVILKRLENRFQSLSGGARDAPARQQTLRNTIDWSYDLLEAGEKMLFARLAVFRGGRALEAIEAVCADGLPVDVFDGLAALVDKNMIRQLEDRLGEPRFVMLETIQEYAWERLEESGEAETIRQRHATYFADFARRAEAHLGMARQQEWYIRLETELDNIRAALSWALGGAAPELGCQILTDSESFWWYQGYHIEQQRWVDLAMEFSDDISLLTRGRLCISASAGCYIVRRDYQTGETLGLQAAEIFQELGEDYYLAHTQTTLTLNWLGLGHDYPSLLKSVDSAASILRRLNRLPLLALCFNMRGEIAEVFEDYDEAEASHLESLKICREIGDRRRESMLLSNLARLANYRQAYDQAEEYLKKSFRLMVELDFPVMFATHLVDYAMFWLGIGRVEQTAQLLGAMTSLQDSMGVILQVPDQRVHDNAMDQVRTQLDDDSFQAAWEAGRNLSYDQVIAFVLKDGE